MRYFPKPAVLVCVLPLVACQAEQKPKIKIGAVVSLSGDCASGVGEIIEAAGLAIEEINAKGGVLGSELELVARDDQSDPAVARDVATSLIASDKPVAIIGAVCSSVTIGLSEATVPSQVPIISPISTSPLLTDLADDGYVFRTASSDALQGRLIARRARERGFTTLSILHDGNGDAYGEGLRDTITEEFTATGGTIVNSVALPAALTDPAAVWQELLAPGRPEAVAVITFPGNAGPLLDTYGKSFSGGGAVTFYFPDALKNSDFQAQLRSAAPNFVITADNNEVTALGAPTTDLYADYVARFAARFDREPDLGTGSPQAYDAMYLIALGLQAAGSASGPALRDALTPVSTGGKSYSAVEFAAAVAAIAAGEDIDFTCVTGDCDFDSNGDVVGVYDVWSVLDTPRGDFKAVASSVAP